MCADSSFAQLCIWGVLAQTRQGVSPTSLQCFLVGVYAHQTLCGVLTPQLSWFRAHIPKSLRITTLPNYGIESRHCPPSKVCDVVCRERISGSGKFACNQTSPCVYSICVLMLECIECVVSGEAFRDSVTRFVR